MGRRIKVLIMTISLASVIAFGAVSFLAGVIGVRFGDGKSIFIPMFFIASLLAPMGIFLYIQYLNSETQRYFRALCALGIITFSSLLILYLT